MKWIHVIASAGVLLACAATVVFIAVAFFGDLFLKSDESLRKVMDLVMYTILAALLVVAIVAAYITCRVCPLTLNPGI